MWYLRPTSEFVFGDDSRYLKKTREGIERKVLAAHKLAKHNCTVNHPAKQDYTIIELRDHGQLKRVGGHINVQGKVTTASNRVPSVVGIAIQPGSYLPDLVSKVKKKTKKLSALVDRYHKPLKPALRCLYAYAVASIDLVARGSFLTPTATKQL